MSRKLKAFTTSAGFFDLAVAAPSMKAALEAWGAESNLFHLGFARQTDDAAIIEATMARPGVVLRRPVGTGHAFTENAEVSEAVLTGHKARAIPPRPQPRRPASPKTTTGPPAALRAAGAYEKEQERRERPERKEEAARQKEVARREQAIAAAQTALDKAGDAHDRRMKVLERAQVALDKQTDAEEARWEKEKERLQDTLRSARAPRHLRLV